MKTFDCFSGMSIRYSIIVPVYNVRPWLRECLDSVLRQRDPNWECICVNDGSTDGSNVILDDYGAKDNRFRVIHKENGGVSSARNVALGIARGEWVVYLDADDILTDDALAIYNRCLVEMPNADILQYNIKRMAEETFGCPFAQDIKSIVPVKWTDRSSIIGHLGGASFVTYAYNRQLCEDVRFRNYIMGEDRLYLATCLARCSRMIRICGVGYGCRMRQGSALRSAWTYKKWQDELNSRKDTVQVILSGKIPLKDETCRMIVSGIMEASSFSVFRLPLDERAWAWRDWFDAVRWLPKAVLRTAWQKTTVFVLRKLRLTLLAYVLCVVPHRLKLIRHNLRCRRQLCERAR